jgi:peptidoglycan-associated lipoprotein
MFARVVVRIPLLAALGLSVACAHHPAPVAAAPAPAPAPAQTATVAAPAPAPAPAPATDDAAARAAAARNVLTQMTFFDFNRSDLSTQDQAILDAKIPILASNTAVVVRVAGNCDDRGSDEYNLALGQRRAEAAKRYLSEHGIASTRITTISYGKERPIASGDTEQAWAQNRNDQFEIEAGGDALRGQ